MGDGLTHALNDLEPRVIVFPNDEYPSIEVRVEKVTIGYPQTADSNRPLYPTTCRQAGTSYSAQCNLVLSFRSLSTDRRGLLSGATVTRSMGKVPIMVMSNRCNLARKTPDELVSYGEEANEMGGYFIVNGLEKVIRMLITPRKNHPMAIQRSGWAKRGANYSDMGVQIRCVRPDLSTASLTLHYLKDGNCLMRFTVRKAEYFIPAILLLRAFKDTSDRILYERLTRLDESDAFISDRVEFILGALRQFALFTRDECLAYIGSRFRMAMSNLVRPNSTPIEVGKLLLKHFVFVHLGEDNDAKFDLLVEMIRKLYAFAKEDISADKPDSLINQDLVLGGNVYSMLFKENIQKYLSTLVIQINADIVKSQSSSHDLTPEKIASDAYITRISNRVQVDLGKRMEHFLATGNLVTDTGLDFQQTTGFAVIAEKLNYLRYLSHFRCVHRGQFFTTMKTTAVRKLLPDSWGFMCPVHTPDGAPCGLLNHMAHYCCVTQPLKQDITAPMSRLLLELGMIPVSRSASARDLVVSLDGRVLGYLPPARLSMVTSKLRMFKTHGLHSIPKDLEIAAVAPEFGPTFGPSQEPALLTGGQYPGLFLFSTALRFSRPTLNLLTQQVEYLSPFEQAYLNVAVLQEDITPATTHAELKPTSMLSLVASCTPFSDFNQSPRNMYQCQMAKQTMGTPCHSFHNRVDTKMYRIQTPQKPITRNQNQEFFPLNEYPNGTNAVVAVISYTGYDMEDAMIINKGSYDRGFKHASVYSTKDYSLWESQTGRAELMQQRFLDNRRRRENGSEYPAPILPDGSLDPSYLIEPTLGPDGLPHIGQLVKHGDPLYCYYDEVKKQHLVVKSKQKEPFYVDQIRRLGDKGGNETFRIKMRFNRNPIVGDKFASRHGQKGVLSKLYPQQDMPFTDNGMVPDLIINPHAFPSRMTIGMLIESMAGKSGALHGIPQSSTPFAFDEAQTPVDYFGEQLVKAGYNYHGNETMYSGITGEPFPADIFIGVVYYQRLRHMVSDKYQVRSQGPINSLTRQPVKGRKAGGGIRLGEMERDSLLAHGTSFILNDRLQRCSDRHVAHVCRTCGSMLSTSAKITPNGMIVSCKFCESSLGIEAVTLPYVFRYLTNELAAMNIRVTLDVKSS